MKKIIDLKSKKELIDCYITVEKSSRKNFREMKG